MCRNPSCLRPVLATTYLCACGTLFTCWPPTNFRGGIVLYIVIALLINVAPQHVNGTQTLKRLQSNNHTADIYSDHRVYHICTLKHEAGFVYQFLTALVMHSDTSHYVQLTSAFGGCCVKGYAVMTWKIGPDVLQHRSADTWMCSELLPTCTGREISLSPVAGVFIQSLKMTFLFCCM